MVAKRTQTVTTTKRQVTKETVTTTKTTTKTRGQPARLDAREEQVFRMSKGISVSRGDSARAQDGPPGSVIGLNFVTSKRAFSSRPGVCRICQPSRASSTN